MWSVLPKYYSIGSLFFLLLCAPPILAADTGYLSPSATGDDYTEWSNPANAFASNNQYAIETRNDQKQDWYDFGFSIPAGSTIDGIIVSVEAQDNYCNAAEGAYVELSWDGGTNYTTTANRFIGTCGSDGITYLGGASDTWNRAWAVDEFSTANFRVRLSKEGYDYDPAWVDHIQVRVHYTGFPNPGGTQTLYLDGVGDESDVPVAVLKTTAPTDTTLPNYDPSRDSMPGLYISKGGSGVNESDPTKYQLWLDPATAVEVDGSVTLDLWTAMKDFDTTKAGAVTAFLVASNADGSVVTQLAIDTISRADWDVGDTGTWIQDTFNFGTVSNQLGGAEQLGVKIIVEPTSGDHLWFAYDTTSYPSALEYGLPGQTIGGTVFEDADFAGTATGYDGGTGDLGLGGVDVELYDAADTYIVSTVTAGDGSFSFAGLADGTYKVRARSATIGDPDTPPAGGYNATVPAIWPYPLPDMAWGHSTALIGGQDHTVDDTATADDAGPGDTYVVITVSGADVTEVNFGFSYELIVNEDDDANADNIRSKQGTLRQFIKNSNAIVGVNKSWFQIPSL